MEKRKYKYLLSFFLILLFVVEYFVREPLFLFSVSFITTIQTKFPYLTTVARLFTFCGTEKGTALIMLLVYNFSNVYKTFLLLLCVSGSAFIGGFLKAIYISPRPFMISADVTILGCEGGWGNPSNHAFCSTCLLLSIYQLYVKRNQKVKAKGLLLIIDLLFIFFICFSRIYLGAHSINQVLFGMILGLSLYFTIFYFFEIQEENPFQFLDIVDRAPLYSLAIVVLFFFATIPLFVVKPDDIKLLEWSNTLDIKCPNFPQAKRFENESIMSILSSGLIICSLLGSFYEYKVIFKENKAKWAKFNFDMEGLSSLNLNLMDERSSDESKVSYRWNNTGFGISVQRLIALSLLCGILISPHFLISYQNNLFIVMTFKVILPACIIVLLLFSYIKHFCEICNLTNDSKISELPRSKNNSYGTIEEEDDDNEKGNALYVQLKNIEEV